LITYNANNINGKGHQHEYSNFRNFSLSF